MARKKRRRSRNHKNRHQKKKQLNLETLDPRVLLTASNGSLNYESIGIQESAAPLAEAQHVADIGLNLSGEASVLGEAIDAGPTIGHQRLELVFVDSNVEDTTAFFDDLLRQDAGVYREVVRLDADSNGLEQMAEILAGRSGIDAVHIVSHGNRAELQLGNTTVKGHQLASEYGDVLATIGKSLAVDGDILVYGCDLAGNPDGERFVDEFSRLTGADMSASDDLTGHAKLGGDWDLEYSIGAIESDIFLSQTGQAQFVSTLDISGAAFLDLNYDGNFDANEIGLGNVVVSAIDETGTTSSTITASDGTYSFGSASGLSDEVRIEFTLPADGSMDYLDPSFGGSADATTVQFANTTSGATGVNVGFMDPGLYCESNPQLLVSCFTNGDPLDGTNVNETAIVGFDYDDEGQSPASSYDQVAAMGDVGPVWGLAYDRVGQDLYSSAVLKRHTGFGPGGIGAVYRQSDVTDSSSTSVFFDFGELADPAGHPDGLGSVPDTDTRFPGTPGVFGEGPSRTQDNVDGDVFSLVGKRGLGGTDVSTDGSQLFVVNLADRQLYEINTEGTPSAAAIADAPWLTDPAVNTNGVARPWAVKYYQNSVYVGVVNDASSSSCNIAGGCSDLVAQVYKYDGTSWSAVFSTPFSLDYRRDYWADGDGSGGSPFWKPWATTYSGGITGIDGNIDGQYAQPILGDLEFDLDGSVVMSFLDRSGLQFGYNAPAPNDGSGSTAINYFAAGDILRGYNNDGTYELENNGSVGPLTSATPQTGGGVGGNEFYQDGWWYNRLNFPPATNITSDTGTGAVAFLPGSGEVVTGVSDAVDPYSAGLVWLNNDDGSYERSLEVYQSDPNATDGTFAKAGGLGDITFVCSAAPLEIGNRVWNDADGDGIQDPGEEGIADVSIELHDMNGNLIGTAVTNSQGHWYFNDSVLRLGPDGVAGGGDDNSAAVLARETEYIVTINSGEFDEGNELGGYVTTTANAGSALHDNDVGTIGGLTGGAAVLNGEVGYVSASGSTYTTGGAGHVDHTLDFGLRITPVDYGDLPAPYATTESSSGASHEIDGITFLGATVDSETDGVPTPDALGDDNAGATDDEDGIAFIDPLMPGTEARIRVTAHGDGFLNAWIDFDSNGTLDEVTVTDIDGTPSTGTLNDLSLADGVHTITIEVPESATGSMAARFRFTADNPGGALGPTGAWANGEVEDYVLGAIGDRVWLDDGADGGSADDGLQNGGEAGIAEVVVNLLDGTGAAVTNADGQPMTTSTDSNGNYEFPGLPAGDYRVEFIAPEGHAIVQQDAGGNEAVDSDADPGSGVTDTVTIGPGDLNPTIDAGVIQEEVDLELTKTASVESAKIGERVTWTIELSNAEVGRSRRRAAATGVVVRDVLPAGQRLLASSVSAPEMTSFSAETGLWTIDRAIAPGETLRLTFDTEVGLALQTAKKIDLQLSAEVDNPEPLEGDTVRINLKLTNDAEGATVSATGAQVAIPWNEALSLKSAKASIGRIDRETGTWSLGEEGLAVGQEATLSIVATVNEDTRGQEITLTPRVAAANELDIDSVAGNEELSEDDTTAIQLNVLGAATRNIRGNIFVDSNIDGIRNERETGVRETRVSLFNTAGERIATTFSNADGVYSFENVANSDLRLEFEGWNTLQNVSTADRTIAGANTRSSIAFIRAGTGDAVADLAMYKPADSAEFVTSCFVFQGADNLDVNTAAALIVFNSDGSVKETVATIAQVGSVNGIGFHQASRSTFAAAFQKRMSDVGPDGNDAIYRLDDAGNVSTFVNLDDFFGPDSAGAYAHDPSDWGVDAPATSKVGKVAFGDVDISEDGKFLYTINLHDRRIYRIPVGTDADPLTPADYSSGDSRSIERFNILRDTNDPDVLDNSTGIDGNQLGVNPELNLRPFALANRGGLIYVGMVNSGQYDAAGNQTANLTNNTGAAYVFTFDPATSQFSESPVLTFGFENLRQPRSNFDGSEPTYRDAWHNWNDEFHPRSIQPSLTDIEFDTNGDMIVGIRDRVADMAFDGSYQLPGPGDRHVSAGDLLRASVATSGGWQIEEHVANNTPNEYYTNDRWSPGNPVSGHFETGQGGLVQVAGFTGISTTAMDADDWVSGGVRTIDNADGETLESAVTLFDRDAVGGFGKANGLGDLEYRSNLNIEVGNRVWIDADRDGIQDASEDAVADVTLHLFDMSDPDSPLLVGTTTTDSNGEYYFNGNNVSYADGGKVAGLRALTDYRIVVDSAEFESGGELALHRVTQQDNELAITGTESVSGEAEFDPNGTGTFDTARNQRIDVLASNGLNADGRQVVITSASGGTAKTDTNGTVIFRFDAGSTTGTFDYEIIDDRLDSDAVAVDSDGDGVHDGATISFTTGAEGSTDHSLDVGFTRPVVDLEIEKLADRKITLEGDMATFTVFLTNNADNATTAASNVRVANTLPTGLTLVADSATSTHGGTFDESTGEWSLVDPLQIGETATLKYKVMIDAGTVDQALIGSAEVTSFDDGGGIIVDVDSIPDNDDGDFSEDDEDDAVILVGELDGLKIINTAQVAAVDQNDVDSSPDNDDGDQSEDDETAAVVCIEADLGDLPDTYGTTFDADGAAHAMDGVTFLGAAVDRDDEDDGMPTDDATGDDNEESIDDEDGIEFLTPLHPGQPADIKVTANAAGFLNAWIDFNSDGTLDEVSVTAVDGTTQSPTDINDLSLPAGMTTLTINVPADATGTMAARFRFTAEAMADDRATTGTVATGEVEDYVLGTIGDVVFFDNGDGGGMAADGIQNGTEPGFAGVVVNLLDDGGTPIEDAEGNAITTTTDANGNYEFPGLPVGDYRVEFVAPDGYQFTLADQGGDGALDSDADPATGLATQPHPIAAGTVDDTVDAGLIEQDMGDLPDSYGTTNAADGAAHGLDGVTFLGAGVDADLEGNPSADAMGDDTNASDDEDGVEFLDPLTAGSNARIKVTASTGGFLNAWIDFNNSGTFESGEQIATDRELAPGMNTLTIQVPDDATGTMAARFRFTNDNTMGALEATGGWGNGEVEDYILGAIGNYVWEDKGAGGGTALDGIQQPGETPVEGVTVYLLDVNGGRITDPVTNGFITATTDASGFYEFAGLPAGSYAVEFEAPGYDFTQQDAGADDALDSDVVPTTGKTDPVTIGAGETNDTLDAGVVDFDYGDLPDEYGTTNASAAGPAKHVIDGVTFLGASVDGESDGQASASATGDDTTGMPDDEDGVRFLNPLVAGTTADVEITASVAGFLNAWIDFDLDGVLDEITVTALNGGASPSATISDLPLIAGVNTLSISVPATAADSVMARFRFTSDEMGGARSPNSSWENGEVEDYLLGALGDRVWVDNGEGGGVASDGIQNGDEPGVEGAVVHLLDAAGDPIMDGSGDPITTMTDENGFYVFTQLNPNDYRVRFELPEGYLFTQANVGGDETTAGQLDSDADRTTGTTDDVFTIMAGDTYVGADAGLIALDYGDLPDVYGTTNDESGPAHGIDGITFLGAQVDSETNGQPSDDARGDDANDNNDDEDGVVFLTPLTAGNNAQIEVTASIDGFLNAWIDSNSNDSFDAGEQIATNLPLTPGANTLDIMVPADATGTMAARFRFTSDNPGTLTPTGVWENGEVEDYILGAIGDYVWQDNGADGGTSGDGIQDAGEPAVEDVNVFLLDGNGDRINDAVTGDPVMTTTDENGLYEFAGLPAGDYAVEFELPTGFEWTVRDAGDDADDSDAGTDGTTIAVSIPAGETNDTLDAGIVEYDYGDLADNFGTTNDSVLGAAKHVLDGQTFLGAGVDSETEGVPTDDATGDDAANTDDEDGVTFLDPLMPGTDARIVVNSNSVGFLNAWIDFNSDGTMDAAEQIATDTPLAAGDNTITVSVPADATGTMAARFRVTSDNPGGMLGMNGTWANGEVEDYVLGSLGDTVFLDDGTGGGMGNDGIQNGMEPGVAGVVVTLLDDSGVAIMGSDGNPVTTTTDENGNYEFAGLPADDYRVAFALPEGFQFTETDAGDDTLDSDANEETGVTDQTYTIGPNTTDTTVDAGILAQDFGDLPESYGTLVSDDGAVHGIDGMTFLGSVVDAEVDGMATEDATGDDSDQTDDDEDGVVFLDSLVAGTEARIEITASRDGFLNAWIDFNGDGTFQSGEQFAADEPLTAGVNTITVNVPADATGTMASRFRFTSDDTGGTLGATGAWDNGEVEDYILGAIGDTVWVDNGAGDGTSGDGIQNGTEPGLAGVTVNLLDGSGAPVLDMNGDAISTTTNADGMYEFTGLLPGDYRVEFVEPSGYDFTDANAGDDATDSDAEPSSGITATTTIDAGVVDDTLDAGVIEYDRGDLPDNYSTLEATDGAKHVVADGVHLGSAIDGEEDGTPTADATGDDTAGATDDEDGVTFLDPLMPGTDARIQVNASVDGFLNAWIDFNSDGVIDPPEQIAVDEPMTAGDNIVTVSVPADATGTMAARFRFTTDDTGGSLEMTGAWDNGEVEDYVLGSIGDTVFLDNGQGGGTGNDGIQNGTESGVENVVVNLLDSAGDAITDANDVPITTTTDENGNYEFPGLPAGDYKVEFELPTGHQFTETDQESDDDLDSDANEDTGITDQTYTIAAGTDDNSVDAGLLEQDFGDLPDVYDTTTAEDGAAHGIDGATYLGSGVDAELDGVPTDDALGDDAADTDDEDGVVFNTPLTPGAEAEITVTASTDGFLNAWIDFNSNDAFDAGEQIAADEPVTAGDNTLTFTVPENATGTMAARFRFTSDNPNGALDSSGAWDNGEVEDYVLGSIGDQVWVDNGAGGGVSGDGIQNGTEPGLEGVVVNLLDGNGDPVLDADGVEITTMTDEDGNYEFPGLPAGEYRVQFVEPTGYDFTDQDVGDDATDSDADPVSGITTTATATIGAGDTDDTLDAGVVEYDRGDLPEGYGTLEADDGPKHVVADGVFLGTTVDGEADGNPSANATGDDVDGTVDDEDGVVFLDPFFAGTEARIQVTAGSDGFLNAWMDFNTDGTLDAVNITEVDGTPTTGTLNDLALTEGTHVITVDVPADAMSTMAARFRFTSDNPNGALGATGAWDNGEVEDYILGSLGDIVWLDNGQGGGLGGNGIQDGMEPGVEGVVVNLLDSSGQPVTDANGNEITTTTNMMGVYQFPELPAGDYQVGFELPTGYLFTDQNAGMDDELDSDVDPDTGISDTVSLAEGEEDMSVDAGLVVMDRGDLPIGFNVLASEGGPSHVVDGQTFLGETVDHELDSFNSAGADRDDTTGNDDEDGITFLDPLMPGTEARIQVVAGSDGFLNAWIDFNDDRSLDTVNVTSIDGTPTTGTISDLNLTQGTHIITIEVPEDTTGTTPARFRFTADNPAGTLGPDGHWDNGEVEDYVLGSIGDQVWVDNGAGDGTSGDGIQNGTEPGLEAVVVNLLDGNGDPVLDANDDPISTTTDSDGNYEFPGLPAGEYQVEFEAPAGSEFTDQDAGGDDATDSDADPADGTAAVTEIEAGETNDTVDAGLVFHDYGDLPDEYGTSDASATGPARHVIEEGTYLGSGIDDEADGAPTADATSDDANQATDDEDGIVFNTPMMPGTSAEVTVTASVDGFLNAWIDFNSDGTLDEVSVTHVDGTELAAPADISDLPLTAGETTIRFDVPADADGNMAARFRFTSDEMGADRSPNSDWDNGEVEDYVLGSLGDQVWLDDGAGGGTAKDGMQHPDETGIEGVPVYLLDANGEPILDAAGDPVATVTDENGEYLFVGLPEGEYRVQFGQPEQYLFTDADQGTDDTIDSDVDIMSGITNQTYTIGPNSTELTADAGMIEVDMGDLPEPYATTRMQDGPNHGLDGVTFLGGSVDGEGNGQPNDNATGDDTLDGIDDEDGVTFLTPMMPGTSANIQVDPSADGYLNGWIDFNSDGTLDEVTVTHVDGTPLTAGTTISDLMLTGGSHILTIEVPVDATGPMAARFRYTSDEMGEDRSQTGSWRNGEVEDYMLGSLGDTVWMDNGDGDGTGNDGIQNGDEPGLEGVVVNLLDETGTPVFDGMDNPVTTTTDENGNYEFSGLPAGDYRVEYELPEGMQFTETDVAPNDEVDSDANEMTGVTDQIYTVEPGTVDETADAGMLVQDYGDLPDSYGTTNSSDGAAHGIDGATFLGDGVDDETDGVPTDDASGDDSDGVADEDGVTFLTPLAAGTTAEIEVVASTDGYLNAWIDFDGSETFESAEQIAIDEPLTAGTNIISVSVPDDATGEMGVRFRFSNDDPAGAMTPDGAWDNGEVEDYILSSLGDYVWYDNGEGGGNPGDGIQDAGEAPKENVEIFLLDGNGDRIQDVAGNDISTMSGPDGSYEFAGLPPGDYSIEVVTPTGFGITVQNAGDDDSADSDISQLTKKSDVVTLGAGETDETVDVGLARFDYGDLPEEYGITTFANDGARHVVDGVTFLGSSIPDIDPDGQPSPDGLGDDNLINDDEDGIVFLSPLMPGGSTDIEVAASTDGYLNAWIDTNSDGVLDEITVTHVDGVALPMPTNIDDLPLDAGTSVLTVAVPDDATGDTAARFRFTSDEMGDQRSQTGQWDNGEVEDYVLGSIESSVWYDNGYGGGESADGIRNGEEPGIPGIMLGLLDMNGEMIMDADGEMVMTMTDEMGEYEFPGVPTGEYMVEIMLPSTYEIGLQDAGDDDTVDSDFDPVTARSERILVAPLSSGASTDPAGGLLPSDATVGTSVHTIWNDATDVATLNFYLEHLGGSEAFDLTMMENLDEVLGSGNYTISNVELISGPASIDVNDDYDGSSDTELIDAGSSLMPGEMAQIQVVLAVDSIVDEQDNGLGFYENQVTITAIDDIDRPYEDTSVDGTNVDPDGNDDPTNNQGPSPGRLTPIGHVGVALNETLAPDDSGVVFDLYLEHLGNTPVDITLVQDLAATFTTGSFEVLDVNFVSGSPTVSANGMFDGVNDLDLVAAGSMMVPGETAHIQVVVGLDQVYGELETQASLVATDGSGMEWPDESHDGTDTDPDDNLDPTDNDDPTDFRIAIGEIYGASWVDLNNDGVFDSNEIGIPDVNMALSGMDIFGDTITMTTMTDANGNYLFDDLMPGEYEITQEHPEAFIDGDESPGDGQTTSGNDAITVTLAPLNQTSIANNFGEVGLDPTYVGKDPFLASNQGDDSGSGPTPPAGLEALDIAEGPEMAVDGDILTIEGSAGDDVVSIQAGTDVHVVSVNQVVYEYDANEIRNISFHGLGGHDRVELTGSTLDDRAVLMQNSARLTSTGYDINIKGTEHISVRGGEGGEDKGFLVDSAGRDVFVVTQNYATMREITNSYKNELRGFEMVTGNAINGGYDIATIYDTNADDTVRLRPGFAQLFGDGMEFRAAGFDSVTARAVSAGNDRIEFIDSSDDDVFIAEGTKSTMVGGGFRSEAHRFESVRAISQNGGNDLANFHDTAGDDEFTAAVGNARMTGSGYQNQAVGFSMVNAYAENGGEDRATLFDSTGNDIFVASPEMSSIRGNGFLHRALGFDLVTGASNAGGDDIAYLHDSAANDTYIGRPGFSELRGDSFTNRALQFETVYAKSNAGGEDIAIFMGGAGNERFIDRADRSQMHDGPNGTYRNVADDFEIVQAHGGEGNDVAEINEVAAGDLLSGREDTARLTGSRRTMAKNFDRVQARTYGEATSDVTDIEFIFEEFGDWNV